MKIILLSALTLVILFLMPNISSGQAPDLGIAASFGPLTNSTGGPTTEAIAVNTSFVAGSVSPPSSVCVGVSITLRDTTTGGVWSSSNTTATVTGGLVTGVSVGIDTIRYVVTGICGTDTAMEIITVNLLPDAGTISGVSNVCVGSSITLTDDVTGGTWGNNNTTAIVTDNIVTGVSAGIDTIRYAVANVCGIDTATKTVTVNPLPSVPVIATQSPPSACTGTMYQNFGAATIPPDSITYEWTAVNAIVWAQGIFHQYSLVSFTETSTAYVTLNATITETGCTIPNTITINVGAGIAQTPYVSYFNNHFVCTPANEDSYQWGYDNIITLDSTILIGEINQDYVNESPDFANNYYWAMTTSGDCLQKTYYITPPATVQNVNDNSISISIFPNPANSIINIAINSADHDQVKVEVFNMLGQKLNAVLTIDNKATIDVTTFPAGSYLITCYRNSIKIKGATFIKN